MATVLSIYKKSRTLKWLTFIIALISIVVISGRVFSLDGKERTIHYENDTWNIAHDFNKDWYFQNNSVRFEINLSDDYEDGINETEVPFQISGNFNGKEIANINIQPIYIEVENDGEEENDEPEQELNSENSENNGENDGEQNEENNYENEEEKATYVFSGRYAVEIHVPTNEIEDGTLQLAMQFVRGNSWGIPHMTKQFHFKRDTTPPEIRLIRPENLNGNLFNDDVTVEIEIEDENFAKELVDITVIKDGVNDAKDWQFIERNNRYSYTTTFSDEGDYEIIVNARDKVGNVAEQFYVAFTISLHDIEFTVRNNDGEIKNGGFSKHDDIEITIRNGIRMNSVEIVVFKDGEELEDLYIDESWFFGRRQVRLDIDLPDDGNYKFETTVYERTSGPFHPGQEKKLLPFTLTLDTTKPTIQVEGIKDGEVTQELPELSITVSDIHLNEEQKSNILLTKDGEEYLNTADFTIVESGDAHVKYKYSFQEDGIRHDDGIYELLVTVNDRAGNEATVHKTFTIDREAPKITITGVENNGYYNKPVLNVTVEDLSLHPQTTSLLVEVFEDGEWHEYDGNLKWEHKDERTMTANYTFTKDGRYRLTIDVTDKAGNRSNETMIFINDTIAPKLTIDGVNNGVEYDKPVEKVTIRVEDANIDLNKTNLVVYKTNIFGNKTRLDMEQLQFKSETVAENEYSFVEDGIYEIEFESTDKAGNTSVHDPVTFTVDTTSPSITVEGVSTVGEPHYNENRDVQITVQDLTLNTKDISIDVQLDGKKYDAKFNEDQESPFKVQYNYEFTKEGTYDVTIVAEDRVKNERKELSFMFVIDKTAPKIQLSGIENNSFIQKGYVNIEVTERYYETNHVEVMVKKDGKEYTHESFPKWENKGETSRLRLPFDSAHEDGEYEVIVAAIDKAGNGKDRDPARVKFTLDNTKPVISINELDRYSNKDVTVTVQVEEENDRTNDVNVEIVKKHPVTKEVIERTYGEWTNNGKTSINHYTFSEQYEYTVHVTAKDAAGNEATPRSVTFTIDKSAPKLSITGVENGEHYPSRNVTFTVEDVTIDLSKTKLTVTRNNRPYNNIATFNMGSNSKTRADLSHTFREEGNYVIQFESTDKAGNKTVHEKIQFVIDSTRPVIQINGVENNAYYNENRNVTVSVEELNYQTNNVEIEVTLDNRPYYMGEWKNTGVTSRLSHTFSQEGEYTIIVAAQDKAGNGPVRRSVTFTIDKTNPEIEISGVENDEYYNTDRRVEVTITDRNLDVQSISVTRNGARYQVGNFRVSGNVASIQHMFSQEGLYVIEVEAIDKASNRSTHSIQFTIDKTPPEITPYMGNSNRIIENGAYINEMFTPRFVLSEPDDTIVSVTLNGRNVTGNIPVASTDMEYHYVVNVEDKAGNETTLEVQFTLDLTNPTLEIKGVLDGFFNQDITPVVTYYDENLDTSRTSVTLNDEPFVNGTRLEEEMDYILQAIVTDLANNVSSRSIVFTIDKTAPIIRFLEPLSGKYFNTVVLPEFIIESLSPYEIIAITLNGEPYTIGEPIEEEGLHVLYFEVMDKAGNITQLTVEFIIDMTAPEVVYEGVEMNETYYEPVDVTIRLDHPDDKFHSITINGELFSGEITNEDGYEIVQTTLSEINEYEIVVEAYDEAGNETVFVLPFEIAEKSLMTKYFENKYLFAGSIVGLAGMASACISYIVVRRRKKKRMEEEKEFEE